MKTIDLTPVEFNLFKELATFFYDFTVSQGIIKIQADYEALASLGY